MRKEHTNTAAVSIILCTYNRADLVTRAIKSVMRQTARNWELVIIDDGSNDTTRQIIEKFVSADARITYYFQQNQGLAKARNAGLKKSKGEFITFVDSDDAYAKDHLEKRLYVMKRKPAVDFLHGGMKLIGPKKKRYVVDLDNPERKIHLTRCHIGGTFFFKREILRRVKGFRALPFGEDFDFFKRVAKHFTIRKVFFPTYLYHLDGENRLCDLFTEKLQRQR